MACCDGGSRILVAVDDEVGRCLIFNAIDR